MGIKGEVGKENEISEQTIILLYGKYNLCDSSFVQSLQENGGGKDLFPFGIFRKVGRTGATEMDLERAHQAGVITEEST